MLRESQMHFTELFIPSWVSCLDESMSTWTNKYTCPSFVVCPQKPKDKGNEYHTICCGLTGIMFGWEIVEGKDRPRQRGKPEFEEQLGKTAGLLMHLCKPIFHTSKYIVLDSGLCVMSALIALKKVGVFVNPSYSDILDAIEDYGLDVVQLHGEETPEFCSDLNEDVEVIKVFHIDESVKDIDALVAPYDEACDYYLFDTKSGNQKGGTGKQFDWSVIAKSKIEKPFFLSGGIGIEDVKRIKAFKHPDFYGVDVNSKVEKAPGEKDMSLVLQFKLGMK